MRPEPQTRRFNLRDLTVLAVIVGLGGLLMLPSVQRLREQQRRAQCLDHLRQIGLACHSHQAERGTFPPLYGWVGMPRRSDAAYGTAFYHLLPFVGAGEVFTQGEARESGTRYYDNSVRRAFAARVAVYECPADPSLPSAGPVTGDYAPCSYAVNAQVFANAGRDGSLDQGTDGEAGTPTAQSDSLAYPMDPDSFGGKSRQTVIVAERYARRYMAGTAWGFPYSSLGPEPWCPFFAGRRNTGGPSLVGDGTGYVLPVDWWVMNPNARSLILASSRFQVQPNLYETACNPHRPSTPHPDGINVACADGSAHTFSGATAASVWWEALVPQRGALGSDW